MQGTRVASRYAKSFIDLTTEQGVFEEAYKDMKYILDTCKSNHDFDVFLKSPVIKSDKKQSVFKKLFEGKLNKVTDAFIHLMTGKRREIYLIEIAQEFVNQYKEKKKILTAIVTTANGIDEVTRKKVMEIVKGKGSNEVVLEEKINKNIIGGFILRVGDQQIDASIARKLNNLKRSFKESPFLKEI
ncbi:MAG: ATP synthase F1 subunit delta [Bacteroidetes bacterium]|nr:ATP synthase F1 subunit delta [Bacteroidota bacterium]